MCSRKISGRSKMLPRILLTLLVAVVAISAEDTDDSRFTNGRPTISGEFPPLASILTPAVQLSHCNGVILDDRHVLTASRCVFNATNHLLHPFWLRITAGDLNIMVPSFRRFTTDVIQIYPHPRYNPVTNENDIAILRVRDRFPLPHNTIDIAIRNQRVLPVGDRCISAGWGANANNAQQVNPVQSAIDTPLLDRTACNAPNVHGGRVQESMICAGSLQNNQPSACQGNIGAGLFCNNQLTGILSFGLGCTAANQPPVFTQVRFFEDWIEQQFNRNDTIPAGTAVTSNRQ